MLILKDKTLIKPITSNDTILLRKYLNSKKSLNSIEKKYVHYYLKNYKEWRDLLLVIEGENQKLNPINNIDYKGLAKRLGSVAAIFMVFISVPQIDGQFDAPVFKSFMEEKNVFGESIEYWEKLFDKYFGGDE